MKSKLFLVALAMFAMGAFAIVGCEPAAEEPAAGGETSETQKTPESTDATTPGTDSDATAGGDHSADDGHGHEGDSAATPEGETKPEGDTKPEGEAAPAPTEGEGH